MPPSIEHPIAARSAAPERPDPSYWTAYDHFMIEREARALRRAYAWSLVGRAFAWLKVRVAGARRDGVRRKIALSPRT